MQLYFINIFFVILNVLSSKSIADVNTVFSSPLDRVKQLQAQSKNYQFEGPNCYATSLYAAGALNDWSYVNRGLNQILKSGFCKKLVDHNQVRSGDLLVLKGALADYPAEYGHAAIFLNKDFVFAKMGNQPKSQTFPMGLKENILAYMKSASPICQKNIFNLKYEQDCLRKSLFPQYFRCDFEQFKTDFEKSDYANMWKDLTLLRQELANLTLVSKEKFPKEKLKSIEEKINLLFDEVQQEIQDLKSNNLKQIETMNSTSNLNLSKKEEYKNTEKYDFDSDQYEDVDSEDEFEPTGIVKLKILKSLIQDSLEQILWLDF